MKKLKKLLTQTDESIILTKLLFTNDSDKLNREN